MKGQSFHGFAKWTANKAGNPGTFAACLGLIIVWAATGPFLGFSDSWQLIINTGTTVVTFLILVRSQEDIEAWAKQNVIDDKKLPNSSSVLLTFRLCKMDWAPRW
jgi:low affinity Fe/Cu permease